MMLDYLGEAENATRLQNAIRTCIASGKVTPDVGGSLTTEEMTREVINQLYTTPV